MKPERWQQLDQLFHSALEREPSARAAFLDEACKDDDSLHKEVESLLAGYEESASFIEKPAIEVEAQSVASDQNELAAGQSIGHYKVISQLGMGGMGEVYLVHDLTLGRKVALKILPDYLTKDPDRLRRFEQEARAASALSHPNIITVHEIGQTESMHFIVSEYIEGTTLRGHMANGPLETNEALDIALQVSSALTAAHARGIVHRDVKPENIMVASENPLAEGQRYIKLVDFGIAKLTEQVMADTKASGAVHTATGLTIGTAPYMSPEQAQGLPVDARTDIWSMGVVLYEMLTGRLPFEGQTTNQVILSILEKEPALLSTYAPTVPGEPLECLIAKALRKDREERHQTAKELFSDLKHLKEKLHSGSKLAPLPQSESSTSAMSWQSKGKVGSATDRPPVTGHVISPTATVLAYFGTARRIVLLMALIITVAGMYLTWKYAGRTSRLHNAATPFSKMTVKRITTNGLADSAAISPDGKYVVHGMGSPGQQSLWLRHVATGSDKEIVPSDGSAISNLTFSPDGNHVYFNKTRPEKLVLIQVPLLGGETKELISEVDSTVSFSPDGNRFAFIRGDPTRDEGSLIIANSDGTGEQEIIKHRIDDFFFPIASGAAWSPDGERIAFGLRTESGDRHRNLMTVDLKNRGEKQITSGPWLTIEAIHWLPDGRGLVITANERERLNAQIWYVSYPAGETRRITNDLNNYQNVSITSDSETLATVLSETNSDIWITATGDSDDAIQVTFNRSDGIGGVAWTPDGKILHVSRASGNAHIHIMNVDGTGDRQLTSGTTNNNRPTSSRDGHYILFVSDRMGPANIWRMDIDGRNAKQLTYGRSDFNPLCSLDNKWVIFTSNRSGKSSLWKVPMDGGNATELTNYLSLGSAISPRDGTILFMFIEEQSQPKRWRSAFVRSDGGQPTSAFDLPQFFGVGGASRRVCWTVDGRLIMYVDTRSGVSNIWGRPTGGGPEKQLTHFKSGLIFSYDWAPDGKQLAVARGSERSDVVLIKDISSTR